MREKLKNWFHNLLRIGNDRSELEENRAILSTWFEGHDQGFYEGRIVGYNEGKTAGLNEAKEAALKALTKGANDGQTKR